MWPKQSRPLSRLALCVYGTILATSMADADGSYYGLTATSEILLTSEAGDKLALRSNISFKPGVSENDNVIRIRPDITKQTLIGIGTSLTESSAFVLAQLEPKKRSEVMENVFGEQGANFSLARSPIGATDFSVEGKYSYAEVEDDRELRHFSIEPDQDGFSTSRYPGIQDENFDLLPMIKQALAIKQKQSDPSLKIIASAWTAPPWMKDNKDWYSPGSPENNYNGGGGALLPEYESTYADYLVKYLDAYRDQGVDIWGITPVNEPMGNNGQWESMHFTPESQNNFIKKYLGPKLHGNGYEDVSLLMLDHSRDHLEQWADEIYNDPDSAKYVDGAAVHWYESTFKVYEDVFERVHSKYPQFSIIHTEGTIDDLGKDAPEGILDPERYKESGWFNNDAFWWNDNATDWAYSATWAGVKADDHPIYTPVHRYARNIIVSLNHWVTGWIDWNIVLDAQGGPNHVGNFCGAPIMVDVDSGYVYYTPIFHILSQLSKTIRPGDHAVQTEKQLADLDDDAIHASASISVDNLLSVQVLNTSKQPVEFALQIGTQYAIASIDANALQTIRIQIPE